MASSYGKLLTTVVEFIRDGRLKFSGKIVDYLEIDDLDVVLFKIFEFKCDRAYPERSIDRFDRKVKDGIITLDWLYNDNAFALFAQRGVRWDADHEPDFSGVAQAGTQ